MFYYYIRILKKLSVLKIWNYLLLFVSFHYSRLVNRSVQKGLPFFISVEPTTSCNLRCPQCPSGLRQFTRPRGMLESSFFNVILSQLNRRLFGITFYFQGEPYLNPRFLDMVKLANDQGIYTSTSTNGHYLNKENARQTVESGLDKITISVDGVTQESFERYRKGGELAKVIEGTKELVRQKQTTGKKHPHITLQFVVFKSNEHEIAAIKKMGKEIGVNEVKIKTAQIYDFENGHQMIPENQKLARYTLDPSGKYKIKNELLNECWRMWQGCVVTWDGKVVPCCFDKDASYRLGDLQNERFEQVWFSPAYNKFRSQVLGDRKSIDICTNCTEGTQVWA